MLIAEVGGKGLNISDSERTECEIWTRVMGYYRPTSAFNIGKKQEFKDRHYYTQTKAEHGLGLN